MISRGKRRHLVWLSRADGFYMDSKGKLTIKLDGMLLRNCYAIGPVENGSTSLKNGFLKVEGHTSTMFDLINNPQPLSFSMGVSTGVQHHVEPTQQIHAVGSFDKLYHVDLNNDSTLGCTSGTAAQ